MAAMGGGFLQCVDLIEIFQNCSPLKPLVRFWNNFTGLFLGGPFSKIVCEILVRRKTWPPGAWGRLFALYGHEEILKNLLLLNPWSDFEIISQECSVGELFQKLFAKF